MESSRVSTVRNRIGWRQHLRRAQGVPVQLDLRAYEPSLAEITVAIYSAVVLMPLFLLWGIVDRFLKKRSR